jgi:hypothetical protein
MSVNNASSNTNNNNAPILPKRSQSRVVLGSGRSPSNSFSNGFVRAAPGGKKAGIILTGHMRTALVMKEEAPAELEKPTLVPNLSLAANATENNVRQAVYLKLTTNRRMSDVLHDRLSTKSRELPNLENKQISRSFEDVPMPVHSSSPRKSRDQQHHDTVAPPDPLATPPDTSLEVESDTESHLELSHPALDDTSQVLLSEEEFLEYIRTRQLEYGEFELEVDHVILDESDDEETDTQDLLTPIAELQSPLAPLHENPDAVVSPATAPLVPPSDTTTQRSPESPQLVATPAHEPSTSVDATPVLPVIEPSPATQATPATHNTATAPHTNTTKLLPWSLNSVRSQLDVLTDIDEQQKGVLWHLFSQVHALVEQFVQASEEWRMQSMNDALNPPIGIQVRAQLCTVLASVFGNNFNSWRLFGQYHFWDYILAATSSLLAVEGAALVQAVNQLKTVSDPNVKFRQLMCAGLNAKQLDKWLDILFNNKEQTTRFYYDTALLRHHPKLISLALQPLSKLPLVLDPDFDARFH